MRVKGYGSAGYDVPLDKQYSFTSPANQMKLLMAGSNNFGVSTAGANRLKCESQQRVEILGCWEEDKILQGGNSRKSWVNELDSSDFERH